MKYHETEHGILYNGESLEVLRTLPDNSVNCCVTSPPYWGLRDYGVDGQLGLEKTPEEYVANMVQLFREVRRVLKADGVLWLNLGDSYAGSGVHQEHHANQGISQSAKRGCTNGVPVPPGLKPKDLVGIPWRVAFALQADGWYLRQDIIWHKPNPMPESVTDRCTKSHEYVFLMSKSAKYYFDSTAIRENCESVCTRKRSSAFRQQNEKTDETLTTVGRNKRSVWTVTTKPFKEAHFATFPRDLIRPMIQAGCPVGGIVLDSFMGSGTTAIEAIYQDKRYIGIELNPKYCEIAAKRIEAELAQADFLRDGEL